MNNGWKSPAALHKRAGHLRRTKETVLGKQALEFTPRRFLATLMVYPSIPMIRSGALSLATKLQAHHELSDIHMSDEVWEFRRPHRREGEPRGLISVTVRESSIEIEHNFPPSGLEQFERLCDQVITAFDRNIAPQFVLATSVELEYVADVSTDSRRLLAKGLGLEDGAGESEKLEGFKRPLSLIGLRLTFPPYDVYPESQANEPATPDELMESAVHEDALETDPPEDTGADWQATVTVQSLTDDPSKLQVEIYGRWVSEKPWEWKNIHKLLCARFEAVKSFLNDKVKTFLEHFRE